MPYLIDGHNLIGRIPDIRLSDLDDENALIGRVSAFCASINKTAEIYFDKAAPGRAGRAKYGRVEAVFVPAGSSADDAIRRRLKALGRRSKGWTVVSSDRQVQAEARAFGAAVIASEDFAALIDALRAPGETSTDRELSPEEVDEWLGLFGKDDND